MVLDQRLLDRLSPHSSLPSLISFNTSVGMLLGPDALLLSSESTMNTISWLSADSKWNIFSEGFIN